MHIRFLLPITLFFSSLTAFSQVGITGPTCVIPGTVYQYNITGSWDSTSTAHICVTGGGMAGATDSCTTDGPPVTFIQITWNSGSAGHINLQSSSGSAALDVSITTPLSGGAIDDSCKNMTIAMNATPSLITCPAATGGDCMPAYTYQWQQSLDNVQWEDIGAATGQQLALDHTLQKITYFRRKVTEAAAGTIAFSDAACIIVQQPN